MLFRLDPGEELAIPIFRLELAPGYTLEYRLEFSDCFLRHGGYGKLLRLPLQLTLATTWATLRLFNPHKPDSDERAEISLEMAAVILRNYPYELRLATTVAARLLPEIEALLKTRKHHARA